MHRLVILAPLLLAAAPVPAGSRPAVQETAGRVYLTVEEALDLAFPHCEIRRETAYLEEHEEARASELAGFPVDTRIVRAYEAWSGGRRVGVAYFDSHQVRTLKETLMVAVDPEARIRRIEVLAFGEPEEYKPRGNWYGQFVGKVLDEELNLKRGIRGVTGATLTARATTDAARRVLALHAVVEARAR